MVLVDQLFLAVIQDDQIVKSRYLERKTYKDKQTNKQTKIGVLLNVKQAFVKCRYLERKINKQTKSAFCRLRTPCFMVSGPEDKGE